MPRSTRSSTTRSRTLQVGDLRVRFVRGRHYVPAWGVVVEAPDGTRLAYTGDTGPSDAVAEACAAPICCWSKPPCATVATTTSSAAI